MEGHMITAHFKGGPFEGLVMVVPDISDIDIPRTKPIPTQRDPYEIFHYRKGPPIPDTLHHYTYNFQG